MAIRLTLLLVLLLLSYRSTDAVVKLCDLAEESCNANEEFTEYTFTSLINDCYDSVREYLGLVTETDTGDDCSTDEESEPGTPTFADDLATGNDFGLGEDAMDDFIEQAKAMALKMTASTIDEETADTFADMMKDAFEMEDNTSPEKGDDDLEYPPMTKLNPGTVGQVKTIELADGRSTTIKTLALKPHVFEIDQFLTDEESDYLVDASNKVGTVKSGVFVNSEAVLSGNNTNEVRNSYSVKLEPPNIDENFLKKIHERISKITNIPAYIIEGSEGLSIGHYKPGGYYHAHYDSNEASRKRIPCCFQAACKDSSGKEHEAHDCCTICRYATFLYYLTDVEGGGETAFPFADMSMSEIIEAKQTEDWGNLAKRCHDSRVVVKPVKGKAIFWYSHLLDTKGYLGGVDKRSLHGGCNVTAGSKWIATNWISTPIYNHRFIRPRYRDISESYDKYKNSNM